MFMRMLMSGIVCVGSGWALYCLSPAGAAEREQARRQAETARQIREQKKSE